MKQPLLGSEYRDLWTMPLRIPVIDLERTGGGMWLRPFYQMVLTGTLAFSDEDPRFDVGIGFFF